MSDEFDSGMFMNTGAWHHLGNVVTGAVNSTRAAREGGVDWIVEEIPIYSPLELIGNEIEPTDFDKIENWKALVRSDNKKVLHVCKNSWTPVQNIDAISWFDPFIESGDAEYSAVVSLYEGRRIAVTCLLKNLVTEIVPNDPVLPYLVLYNSHDGSLRVGIKFTPIRVVCANTLRIATMGDNRTAKFSGNDDVAVTKKLVRIKHTKNVNERLLQIREFIDIHRQEFEVTTEQFKIMAGTQIKGAEMYRHYLENIFKKELQGSDRHGNPKTIENLDCYEQLLYNFERGVGIDTPGVRGTVWAAYNSVTEWVTHQRGRTNDELQAAKERLNSVYFGEGNQVIGRAHQAALSLCR